MHCIEHILGTRHFVRAGDAKITKTHVLENSRLQVFITIEIELKRW